MMTGSALLEVRSLRKACGGGTGPVVMANDDVSFSVTGGSIHAVIGENGAGKSTLMKALFGLQPPDSGEILLRGHAVTLDSPNAAKKLGLGMVQQHFMLGPGITALDHLFLEDRLEKMSPRTLLAPLPRRKYLARVKELAQRFRMETPWSEKVENLSVGFQQRVELMKLLFHEARILILDEPTALLSPLEVETLLNHLRELRSQGLTILFITHKLNEVFAVADAVTILRKGKVAFTGSIAGQTPQSLASLMVGRELAGAAIHKDGTLGGDADVRAAVGARPPVLELKNFHITRDKRPRVRGLSFAVAPGEIVGIAGVEGQGQSDLLRYLADPTDPTLRTEGTARLLPRADTGFVGEDRLTQSVIPELSVLENFFLGHERRWNPSFVIPWKKRAAEVAERLRLFDVQPLDPWMPLGSLSGGNQQKVVIARELGAAPRFVIVAQPTRGVDFSASLVIHEALMGARERGAGILLVSSDLPELLKLSDRLLVMNKGEIRGEFRRGAYDTDQIAALMGGVS